MGNYDRSTTHERLNIEPIVDFILIGSMKSGTTSLHSYLSQHPGITMSRVKETNLFVDPAWKDRLDWYESQFDYPTRMRGESSTNYTKHPLFDNVPSRMRSAAPDAKLIYLLRDPVERIKSHLHHNLIAGRIRVEEIDAALRAPQSHYVMISRYFYQLTQYLEFYAPEQFKLVTTEDLKRDPAVQLASVCRFLGVDDAFRFRQLNIQKNASRDRTRTTLPLVASAVGAMSRLGIFPDSLRSRFELRVPRPELSKGSTAWLIDELQEDVEHLSRFSDRDYVEWSNFR